MSTTTAAKLSAHLRDTIVFVQQPDQERGFERRLQEDCKRLNIEPSEMIEDKSFALIIMLTFPNFVQTIAAKLAWGDEIAAAEQTLNERCAQRR